MPIAAATAMGGARNCHTEMPAARATTSSSLRESASSAAITPNSVAKGRTCSEKAGIRNSEAAKAIGQRKLGRSTLARTMSRKSNRNTIRKAIAKIVATE